MVEAAPPLAEEETGLYEVVPEKFVSVRDDLARRMRAAGDKAGAARVAKLRRPPLTTWALNQVARAAQELVEDLHAAGGELRAAMERALDGDASALRPAQLAERSAVDAVVTEAATRLVRSGYSLTDVMRSRMAETLRAAIVDESVAQRLRAGALERDHDAPGFGLDGSSLPLGRPRATAPAGAPVSEAEAEAQDSQQAEADAERQETQRKEARRLAAESDRLTGEAQGLGQEADRLEALVQRLEAEAGAARERADQARHRAAAAAEAAAATRAEAVRAEADR